MYGVFNIKALIFILELDLFFNGSNMKPDLNIRPNQVLMAPPWSMVPEKSKVAFNYSVFLYRRKKFLELAQQNFVELLRTFQLCTEKEKNPTSSPTRSLLFHF